MIASSVSSGRCCNSSGDVNPKYASRETIEDQLFTFDRQSVSNFRKRVVAHRSLRSVHCLIRIIDPGGAAGFLGQDRR